MLSTLKVLTSILLLAVCTACGESQHYESDSDLVFFNPLYGMPGGELVRSCVIDAKISMVGEKAYLATLDRIAEETNNDIMYSRPDKRDRVAYVAPVDCDEITKESAFSPHDYFDAVSNVSKSRAGEHPFLFELADYNPKEKLVADLNNAAFAAELDFSQASDLGDMRKHSDDIFCILNANLRVQSKFGLPLTFISVRDSSLLYVYNTDPANTDLVYYLIEEGFAECGVEYDYEVRSLNAEEISDLSVNFIEGP